MKILIAYYSKTGNTKKVAEELASKLGADSEEIIDKKNRAGIINWILSGRDGIKKRKTEIGEIAKNPAEYDLVILGSPVWAGITPAVRTYAENNGDRIKNYAFFITSGSATAQKMLPKFQEMMDRDPLAYLGLNSKELKNENIYEQKIADFVKSIEAK